MLNTVATMKAFMIVGMCVMIVSLCGCQSIHLGGSGDIGGIRGGAGVDIPLPK